MLGKAKKGIRDTRYYKSVGLGIKTPRTAIEGTYVDKKCPWTGALRPPLRACMVERCRRRGSQRRASLQSQRARASWLSVGFGCLLQAMSTSGVS